MKLKILAAAALLTAFVAAIAVAEVRNIPVTFSGVDSVVTPATVNGTAIITSNYHDISWGRDYSVQWRCISTAGAPSITVEWLSGGFASSSHMQLTNLSAVASSSTAETWSAVTRLQQGTIVAPRAPVGALRFSGMTGNQTDTACSGIIILGD